MIARSNVGVMDDTENNNTTTSNCKVINKLKAEISYKKSRAREMSSRSDRSVASSACNSAASSCYSVSSRNRRRNREALIQQQVHALSIEPFAGLSTTTKSTKPTKPASSPRKWFKRRRDNNKVADSSTSESRNPPSILRNNKYLSLSGMEERDPAPGNGGPTVRFAEGTVFQDPLIFQRRKVPRTKDRLRKQRQKSSVIHLVNRALPLFRDMVCSRMTCV